MEEIIFVSSFINSKFYLSTLLIAFFIYIENIGKGSSDIISSITYYLIAMIILCIIGIFGGKITMTNEALIFYYPIRPFYRKFTIKIKDIEKLSFVQPVGKGGHRIVLYFKNEPHKKAFSNPLSYKEQKVFILKLQEKGIKVESNSWKW